MEYGLLTEHPEYHEYYLQYKGSYDPWFGSSASQYIPLPLPESSESCVILPIIAPGKGVVDNYSAYLENRVSRYDFFETVQAINTVIAKNAAFIRNFSLIMCMVMFVPLIVTVVVLLDTTDEMPYGHPNVFLIGLACLIPVVFLGVIFVTARYRRRRSMIALQAVLSEENMKYQNSRVEWRIGFTWIEIQLHPLVEGEELVPDVSAHDNVLDAANGMGIGPAVGYHSSTDSNSVIHSGSEGDGVMMDDHGHDAPQPLRSTAVGDSDNSPYPDSAHSQHQRGGVFTAPGMPSVRAGSGATDPPP